MEKYKIGIIVSIVIVLIIIGVYFGVIKPCNDDGNTYKILLLKCIKKETKPKKTEQPQNQSQQQQSNQSQQQNKPIFKFDGKIRDSDGNLLFDNKKWNENSIGISTEEQIKFVNKCLNWTDIKVISEKNPNKSFGCQNICMPRSFFTDKEDIECYQFNHGLEDEFVQEDYCQSESHKCGLCDACYVEPVNSCEEDIHEIYYNFDNLKCNGEQCNANDERFRTHNVPYYLHEGNICKAGCRDDFKGCAMLTNMSNDCGEGSFDDPKTRFRRAVCNPNMSKEECEMYGQTWCE